MIAQSLTRAELDDEYHHAIFDCDDAVAKAIHAYFNGKPGTENTRDDLIDLMLKVINDCEVNHLGGERYALLLQRLYERNKEGATKQ